MEQFCRVKHRRFGVGTVMKVNEKDKTILISWDRGDNAVMKIPAKLKNEFGFYIL